MRRFWALALKELRQIRRDRRLTISLIVPPTPRRRDRAATGSGREHTSAIVTAEKSEVEARSRPTTNFSVRAALAIAAVRASSEL